MKLLTFLSGGIDSPVAAYIMMKKHSVDMINFHNYDSNETAAKTKLIKLLDVLRSHQKKTKLLFFPFREIQMQIVEKIDPKYRTIIYRRIMFRIADKIAKKYGYDRFVTGEALGQVASQTLQNLYVINEAAKTQVVRPLLGFDKAEIIGLAKRIGTYDISISDYAECVPYSDTCTSFAAKHPTTAARLDEIKEMERSLKFGKLIDKAMRNL